MKLTVNFSGKMFFSSVWPMFGFTGFSYYLLQSYIVEDFGLYIMYWSVMY